MKASTYDKFPAVRVSGRADRGWGEIAQRLASGGLQTIAIECYPGVHEAEIRDALGRGALWISASEAMLSPAEIDQLVEPDLGGDDPVFGRISRLTLDQWFDPQKLAATRARIARSRDPVIVCGPGAAIIAPESSLLVYADLARWVAQGRQRRNEISNLGVDNPALKSSLKYKRAFFIDWRVADRFKRETMTRWDWVLDTCAPGDPKLVSGGDFRAALAHCATRPFRVVPLFDPGPWGGQWMKEVCDLDRSAPNYAWCFDCVPEENSLLLEFGDVRLEAPSIDLVFAEPRALLGEAVYGRFGAEFPIRFDFLDTMGGGNLSFQVHPLTDYIRTNFNMPYTQDESYYMLDAEPGAVVFLGCKDGADPDAMFADLAAAQRGEKAFDDERFVARFPARKHDHFLIPAGTLHCSGAGAMVLEISATPYIFTFKLWDWERLGLDGKPRPIHLEHGRRNVQWERNETYARTRLVNQFEEVASGEGWREERTGLHEAEFIETRRHWFRGPVDHHTHGGVNVLNLIEGPEAIIESPTGAFEPFVVHYAETFIVPAAVGAYRIRPGDDATECATLKAFVRTQA